ncbi:MAG: outer membrane protein assembly factor BamE [Hyphomicrobiales bacterium]|nr:outer membrane protein assembly factor BamE [Hyphomicrobiales bacterium]MCY4048157.1 outer membrane protein assembly factor BamE [Hyphomicrobiales bacterium]MCY4053827.1 outer membrane protein assembly factor BamE [Hyphomicrobiales bacterium]
MAGYLGFRGFMVIAGMLAVSACAASVDQRGHIFDDEKVASIQIGEVLRADVARVMGSPTVLPVSGGNVWYYVGGDVERFAFFYPTILDRKVVAFHFGEDGLVESVEMYGLEDGVDVSFVDDVTPSRGRNLSLLEEIFGNIGRFTPAGLPQP